jgi:hypothetical protein
MVVGGFTLTQGAAAQAGDVYQQGVRAYQRLEFDAAAALFQRSLDLVPHDAASLATRSQVLDYLAASVLFRGNRDSAAAVFRRLLEADPRHHPNDLVFPPDVTGLFDEVRRNTPIVVIEAQRDAAIRLDGESWTVRLAASAFHHIDVTLLAEDSSEFRGLYSGPIWDTLTLQWNIRDSLGKTAPSGHYTLAVISRSGQRSVRAVRLPLEISVMRRDTLQLPPPPPDSLRLPERTRRGPGIGSLFTGVGLAVAVAALPAVLADGAKPTPARFVVGGALSIAGIAGFLTHRPGQLIVANAAANRTRWDAWQAQIQTVGRENAERRRDVRVTVKVGTPVTRGT